MSKKNQPLRITAGILIGMIAIVGCNSGSSSSTTSTYYNVGGNVTGLDTGESVDLVANGNTLLTVESSSSFSFHNVVAKGGNYFITVLTTSEGKICNVTNASAGTNVQADVNNVEVTCSAHQGDVGTLNYISTTNLTGASMLRFGHNGNLYVAATTSDSANAYSIAPTGKLIVSAPQTKGGTNGAGWGDSLVISPTSGYVYFITTGSGAPNFNNAKTGAYSILTPDLAPVSNGFTNFESGSKSPYGAAITSNGKYAYFVQSSTNDILQYNIESSNGNLSFVESSTISGNIPLQISITKDDHYAYVLSYESNLINMYSINESNGKLTALESPIIATGLKPSDIAISPNSDYVYVANSGESTISQYSISPTTGELTLISNVSSGVYPSGLAISPNGKYLYAASYGDNLISQYSVNSSTGQLLPLSTASIEVGYINNLVSIVVSPDNKYVYTTGSMFSSYGVMGFSTGM